MLLNSTGVIAKSQHEEESALLRRKVEELNKNTARLIVEAGKLIQESKQLSAQLLAPLSLLNDAVIFFGNVRLCSVLQVTFR